MSAHCTFYIVYSINNAHTVHCALCAAQLRCKVVNDMLNFICWYCVAMLYLVTLISYRFASHLPQYAECNTFHALTQFGHMNVN